MGVAVPILGAVGTGISAIGAIGQGESAAAEARYQAQIAKNNAQIANQNAAYSIAAGQTQATNVGLRERAQAGQITSAIAANNLDVNAGSARQVRSSQAQLASRDVAQTEQNAALQAYGYRSQATSFQAESNLEKAEAPYDVLGGSLTALGTLASGASNVGYKWAGLANPTAAASGAIGAGLPL